ncbi:MAG: IclR family transcriptional regulator [Opitutales bacterium]|nr:IclR family transcriptional regulator [Opitutales bacterium]
MNSPPSMEKYIIPNLRNACRLLKWLGEHPEGSTIPDLARDLDIPRTTALRIVRTLAVENLLRQEDSVYKLGARMISLGLSARSGIALRELVVPHLRTLMERTKETAHAAIPCEGRTLIIEVCDSVHPIRAASRAGTVADAHCSSTGKIFLAHIYADELEKIFPDGNIPKRTKNTLTTFAKLRKEAEKVRKQGYSVDDEEFHEGVRCLAAPIRDASGRVIAAIGITASKIRFKKEREAEFAAHVRAVADAVTREMGGEAG